MHNRKYSNFLIISFAFIFIYGIYYYYSNNLINSEAASGSITSSLDSISDNISSSSDNEANEDTAFVRQLASLKDIKVDASLFESQGFSILIDNSIKLEESIRGRKNPFSPVGKIVPDLKPSSSIVTGVATSVTNSGAILNGSVEGLVLNNVYFEYGNTQAMDKVTAKVTPSSVGGLAVNINGLTSKTQYFYRVVVNVNGVMSYGDIMSFITK